MPPPVSLLARPAAVSGEKHLQVEEVGRRMSKRGLRCTKPRKFISIVSLFNKFLEVRACYSSCLVAAWITLVLVSAVRSVRHLISRVNGPLRSMALVNPRKERR